MPPGWNHEKTACLVGIYVFRTRSSRSFAWEHTRTVNQQFLDKQLSMRTDAAAIGRRKLLDEGVHEIPFVCEYHQVYQNRSMAEDACLVKAFAM